jgi:hypothetical protein
LLLAAAASSAHQPLRALSKTQHQRCHHPAATRCCFPAIDTAKLAPTFLVRATLRADHQSKCVVEQDVGGELKGYWQPVQTCNSNQVCVCVCVCVSLSLSLSLSLWLSLFVFCVCVSLCATPCYTRRLITRGKRSNGTETKLICAKWNKTQWHGEENGEGYPLQLEYRIFTRIALYDVHTALRLYAKVQQHLML